MFVTLPPDVKTLYLKISMSNNIVYAIALTSVKISILCLYLRALRYGYIHLATKVMLGIVIITHVWIIISLFTVCIPLSAVWDVAQRKTAYCHSFSVYWSHSGINISTDFLIFALPLCVLNKLQVPQRQKIALGFVFVLAFRCAWATPPTWTHAPMVVAVLCSADSPLQRLHRLPRAHPPVRQRHHAGRPRYHHHCVLDHSRAEPGRHLCLSDHHQAARVEAVSEAAGWQQRPDDLQP